MVKILFPISPRVSIHFQSLLLRRLPSHPNNVANGPHRPPLKSHNHHILGRRINIWITSVLRLRLSIFLSFSNSIPKTNSTRRIFLTLQILHRLEDEPRQIRLSGMTSFPLVIRLGILPPFQHPFITFLFFLILSHVIRFLHLCTPMRLPSSKCLIDKGYLSHLSGISLVSILLSGSHCVQFSSHSSSYSFFISEYGFHTAKEFIIAPCQPPIPFFNISEPLKCGCGT